MIFWGRMLKYDMVIRSFGTHNYFNTEITEAQSGSKYDALSAPLCLLNSVLN
jgi:hypothetical protein